MRPVIIVRPQPGAMATEERAASLGLTAQVVPLFAAEPRPWSAPSQGKFDALLVTSANAVRHAGAGIAALAGLPCHAVGPASAAAAQAAGLSVVATGAAGAQPLVDAMVAGGARQILWVTGEDRTALDSGQARITPLVTYAMRALPPPPALAAAVAQPAVMLLHSARAATRAAELAGDARKHLIALAISPAVAAVAGPGWEKLLAAPVPDDAAMLELAVKLCQQAQG